MSLLARVLQLKPFDEAADAARAGAQYAGSGLLTVAVVLSALLSLAALLMVIAGHRFALAVLAAAVATSAVTAGLEFNAGLRARALNQLFSVAVAAVAFALLRLIP